MDIKKINETLKKLREQIDIISFNLHILKGLEKNTSYKNAVYASENMRAILENQISELSNELRTNINEEIDGNYIAKLVKIGSPKDDVISRIGKVLGIKKALVDGIIRTANENRSIKIAKAKQIQQSKKS